jgi:hypothetical protein
MHAIEYDYAPKSFEETWEKMKIEIMIISLEIMTEIHFHTLVLNSLKKFLFILSPLNGT